MAKQKALQQKQSVRKYLTAENAILFVAMLLPLISVYYDDANSIIRQGMNVWEALFSGHFLHYFSYIHNISPVKSPSSTLDEAHGIRANQVEAGLPSGYFSTTSP